jgi:hypothetical protein
MSRFSNCPSSGTTSGNRCPRDGGRMFVRASAHATVIGNRKWYLGGLVTEQGVEVQCARCGAHATEPLKDWAVTMETES